MTSSQHSPLKRTRRRRIPISIRWRMTVGILLSFLLLFPVVGLSLFYLRDILNEQRRIIEVLAVRRSVAATMLAQLDELRQAEVRYLVSRDQDAGTVLKRNLADLLQISGQTLPDSVPPADLFRPAREPLDRYRQTLNSIVLILEEDGKTDPYVHIESLINRFQRTLEQLLEVARRSKDPAEREGAYRRAHTFIRDIEHALLEMETGDNPTLAALLGDLQTARHDVRNIVEEVERTTFAAIESGRHRIVILSNRARKNIFSMSLLTLVLGLIWTYVLPQRFVLSIHRITRILRLADRGEIALPKAPEGEDEIGRLGYYMNRYVAQVSTFDRLKTEKIQEGNDRLRVLAGCIDDLVLVVDDTLKIVFASDSLLEAFGLNRDQKRQQVLRALSDIPQLQDAIRTVVQNGEDGRRIRIAMVTPAGPGEYLVARGILPKRNGSGQEMVIAFMPAEEA